MWLNMAENLRVPTSTNLQLFVLLCQFICVIFQDSLESAPLSKGFKQALASVDKKLIIVPVAYVLLRVWGKLSPVHASGCCGTVSSR